jgi:hypothetical protein
MAFLVKCEYHDPCGVGRFCLLRLAHISSRAEHFPMGRVNEAMARPRAEGAHCRYEQDR